MSMTIANWCILVAGLFIPMGFTVFAKASKDFDNARPRDYMARLEGAKQRANWAVQNGHETFPLFVAAVLLAERAGAAQPTVDILAVAFVALRVVFGLMYVFDKSTLRSLVWIAATGCIVTLFAFAA